MTRAPQARRRGRAAGALIALSAGVGASACTISGGVVSKAEPRCGLHSHLNALVLEAQAVPSAERVPCVSTLPPGWGLTTFNVRRGQAEIVLGSDRGGTRALRVRLNGTCDTTGATEVPSGQPGPRRFERIESVAPGFSSTRYYTFAGGCISYRFRLSAAGRALVDEGAFAVDSVTRTAIASEVRRVSHGDDHL